LVNVCPWLFAGSKLKTARRNREAELPSKLKTYARKKRRAQ
jgi:hypothetical protein